MEKFSVYILANDKNSHLYVGMATDVENRLTEHNAGKTKSTKAFVPWKIIYQEVVGTSSEARIVEKRYKATSGKVMLRKKGLIP